MPKTVRAILGDIYDAWRAQNLDWMATYLPDDFCHVIHIPLDLHPLGGTRCGKKETLERLRLIAEQFDFVIFDTSGLLIESNRAAVEVPIHYRHRESGAPFESTKANFWTLEDGWPRAGLRRRPRRRPPGVRGMSRPYPRPCSAASSSIVG